VLPDARTAADGILYLRDTCLTLASLVAARPAAAALLLQQGPALMEALSAVHDQLLPAAQRAARAARPDDVAAALLLRRACQVELGSERLAQLLLLHGCVAPPDGSVGAAGSGAAGSSAAGAAGGSPVARGEALLQALMLLGHREEEAGGGGAGLSLGQALARRYGLGGSIEAALLEGSLSLDEAQADYVAALLGVASLADAPGPQLPPDGRGSTAGTGSGKEASSADHAAALQSKIQQVCCRVAQEAGSTR
jgi:hypothetical protein